MGVKALSLAVTDGFFLLFSLRVSPKRLGHISAVISNRVLCLYELIKDGRKQREGHFYLGCIHLSLSTDYVQEFNACPAWKEFQLA